MKKKEEYTNFIKKRYKILLAQRGIKTIYTQGPSGTGKSYIQYGVDKPGIDSVLLEYTPNVETTMFYDKYFLGFAFQESYEAAALGPVSYYYSIENINDELAKVMTKATPIKRELLKKDYYNLQIKKVRMSKDLNLIRRTENNKESSRAFLVASVKGREEGGSGQNITNMVDSPGFELVPVERQQYTNPFIHLFYKIASMVTPITPINIPNGFNRDDITKQIKANFADWFDKAANHLAIQMKTVFEECEWPVELFKSQMKSTRVPMPPNVTWEKHGLVDSSFEEFINSTVFTASYKRIAPVNSTWSLDTTDGVISVYDTRGPSMPQLFQVKTSDSMQYNQSKRRYQFFETQKQNLILDGQLACVIAWTYMIYRQIFKTSLPSSATASTSTTYSARVKKFIKFVSDSRAYHGNTKVEEDMLLTCEAVFINQFNMWVSESTGKTDLMTPEKYVRGESYSNKTSVTEDSVFYEFLLLVSDNRLDSVSRTQERDKYNQFTAGYEYLYNTPNSQGNALAMANPASAANGGTSSSYDIFWRNMNVCADKLNKAYPFFNSAYSPYDKMNNLMRVFNSFLIHDSLNLFFYVFNSIDTQGYAKKDIQYFPFMDINMKPAVTAAAP